MTSIPAFDNIHGDLSEMEILEVNIALIRCFFFELGKLTPRDCDLVLSKLNKLRKQLTDLFIMPFVSNCSSGFGYY